MQDKNLKKIEAIRLKKPLQSYPPRLDRFLKLIIRVRELSPGDVHLWSVMDMVSFQDTETALNVVLINQRINGSKV